MVLSQSLSTYASLPTWLLLTILVWSLFWKGLALWKSAKRNSKFWFVAILLINTVGILEVLYIFLFSEININKLTKVVKKKSTKKKSKK